MDFKIYVLKNDNGSKIYKLFYVYISVSTGINYEVYLTSDFLTILEVCNVSPMSLKDLEVGCYNIYLKNYFD